MFHIYRFLIPIICLNGCLAALEETTNGKEVHHYSPPAFEKITPFTSKVAKSRVRLRLEPTLDGTILEELDKGDYLIVIGKVDDYYAVRPPAPFKGYIYRTYVNDGVVEGNYVNVRLAPHLEGDIVTQATSGEILKNPTISEVNSKWLEFDLPDTVAFFVSKDYLEEVGDEDYLSVQEKRQQKASELLDRTYLISENELQKPLDDINLNRLFENLNVVIQDYGDFPEQVERARDLVNQIQDRYLEKKISYLEAKTESVTEEWELKNSQLTAEIETQKRRLQELETELPSSQEEVVKPVPQKPLHPQLTTDRFVWEDQGSPMGNRLTLWIPAEKELYQDWVSRNGEYSMADFYSHQYRNNSIALRGTIEPYRRSVKNKPGDYLLLSPATRHPIAYLYSTQIDLEHYVGKEMTIIGLPRPNNHFAFPAYFVVAVD